VYFYTETFANSTCMTKKKHIRGFMSISYKDKAARYYGYILDYNDDWTLMLSNDRDFMVNGFVILRHKNIKGFRIDEKEIFIEKVIRLKKIIDESMPIPDVPMENLESILPFLTNTYGVFSFELKSEKACYLGRLKSITSKELIIDYLNTRGEWDGTMKFRPGDVRVIEFDTDYINSLMLVGRHKVCR
jgi:hypothetical protein